MYIYVYSIHISRACVILVVIGIIVARGFRQYLGVTRMRHGLYQAPHQPRELSQVDVDMCVGTRRWRHVGHKRGIKEAGLTTIIVSATL